MMKFDPKKEVPSLELCKKLKKLAFPQEGGGWYWEQVNEYINPVWEKKWELNFYTSKNIEYCPHFLQSADPDEYVGSCDLGGGDCKREKDFWDCEFLRFYKAPTIPEMVEWLSKIDKRNTAYRYHYNEITPYRFAKDLIFFMIGEGNPFRK